MDFLESILQTSENGVDVSKKYLLTSYKYTKLKIFYLLSYSLSTFIKVVLLGSFLALGFLFVSMGAAMALGEYLNHPFYGYLIVGGSLFVIGFITLLFRKIIDKKIIEKVRKNLF